MKLAKFSLFTTALIFLGIGLFCLFAPIEASTLVDIQLSNATAITDFRANYGGCIIGIGLFYVYCYLSSDYIRLGLILQALSFGGFVVGRLIGIIFDGIPKPLLIYFLIAELIMVIVAIISLNKVGKTRRPYLYS
ncbi:MAG: DUF4345 domain-containing protein [Acidobacteriota bacterium]